MSFITVTAYAVLCDACGQRFLGHEGEQLDEDPTAIDAVAGAYHWTHSAGRHICHDCRHLRGIDPGDVPTKEVDE